MKIILGLFLTINLFAVSTKYNIYALFQEQKYSQACDLGFKNFYKNIKDENFLSVYAFSCLKADNINRLSLPVANLKASKESRANASYFSVILMQKKLLYHALIDGYDFTNINLPSTDYVLSKVFDLYVKLGKHNKQEVYFLKDTDNDKLTYKMYLIKHNNLNKIVIEEFYDTIVVKRHVYW